MDALGFDAAAAGQQALAALAMTAFIFFVVSPIAGYYLHKYIKSKTPDQDTFAILAGAFCLFLVVAALIFGLLARFTTLIDTALAVALLISAAVGLTATGAAAVLVVRMIAQGKQKIKQEDYRFGVWEEDKRQVKTHRHKKR